MSQHNRLARFTNVGKAPFPQRSNGPQTTAAARPSITVTTVTPAPAPALPPLLRSERERQILREAAYQMVEVLRKVAVRATVLEQEAVERLRESRALTAETRGALDTMLRLTRDLEYVVKNLLALPNFSKIEFQVSLPIQELPSVRGSAKKTIKAGKNNLS
ncbi:Forkhead box protein I1-A [Frankliniella fusca]|uniref:Forkhead box protein I1-A n=1 Tax=Frankliniella fusca TaxID=407009 RepID=A0AAE1HBL2_9NEOP|nr:Forkhead box protein I1-A [Frankliniella fusca]KAK3918298.1 Forkhead box protein I1-A [Frankliniella fusca]